jgi:hypothetical protein
MWPCGLRRRSSAARLLGSRVRIPPRAWMFVSFVCVCVCCVVSGLCGGLLTRSDESCRRCVSVSNTVWSTYKPQMRRPRPDIAPQKKKSLHPTIVSSSNFSISPFLMIILSIAYETKLPRNRALYLQLSQSLAKSHNKSGLLFTLDRLDN